MRRLVPCLFLVGVVALRPHAPHEARRTAAPVEPEPVSAVSLPCESLPATDPEEPAGASDLAPADEVFYPPHLTPEDAEIVERLHSAFVPVDFNATPLPAVIDYLREISGLNFIIDIVTIPDPADERVTIAAAGIAVREVLRRILPPLRLAHSVEGGVVIITSRERLRRRVVLELYDVGRIDAPEDDVSRLVRNEAGDDWCEDDGKSIQAQNGLLIVRTSRDVHARIAALIDCINANPQPWIALIDQRRR